MSTDKRSRSLEWHHSNKEKSNASSRAWYHANKEKAKAYSLTLEEVIELVKVTHCESCGVELSEGSSSDTTRHFDHCHETGAFRGVLCSRCNRALGLLNDDPVKLQALIDYLKKHDTEQ